MPTLNETLGTLPSGRVVPLSDDDMTKHLRENYINSDREKMRKDKARKRLDLYHDRGEEQIDDMVNSIFRNSKVKRWRRAFVGLAQYQNITKRIVREISAVYSEPAIRRVGSSQETYAEVQRLARSDRRMRTFQRRLNLLNDCVIWPRISRRGVPELRIVSPDMLWAVSDPNDPSDLVALIFERTPSGPGVTELAAHYAVVTDEEVFNLDAHGRMVDGSRMPHGMSRMPMILAHREDPENRLLDPDPGEDLISAHKAITLINVMLLKHQKSGNKQAVATGDTANMANDQPMDEEHVLAVPDGVVLSTIDLGAQPSSYIETARSIIKQIASNYNIPESVFDLSYQATSGFEIELKRSGLREIRHDQILDFRPLERELAELQSELLTLHGHPLAFSADGWGINFGEVETPADPMQRLGYWKELRSMGLMNTVEMYMQMNPEATAEEAMEAIVRNAEVEARRVELFRELQVSPIAPSDGSEDDSEEDVQDE